MKEGMKMVGWGEEGAGGVQEVMAGVEVVGLGEKAMCR